MSSALIRRLSYLATAAYLSIPFATLAAPDQAVVTLASQQKQPLLERSI